MDTTSKGMVKRRKKGKRKARRTAQQPTQFARPLRCSAALAALLKPHCEMGTDARLAVGGALLLTRAAATCARHTQIFGRRCSLAPVGQSFWFHSCFWLVFEFP